MPNEENSLFSSAAIPNAGPAATPPAAGEARRKRKPRTRGALPADLKFETAIARLEAVVAAMEKGELSLEDSLRHFEEGTALARFCDEQLKALEKRVEILTKGSDGEESWQPYAGGGEDDDASADEDTEPGK